MDAVRDFVGQNQSMHIKAQKNLFDDVGGIRFDGCCLQKPVEGLQSDLDMATAPRQQVGMA